MHVLDVGAGVGKLCLIGALTTRASWVGIESSEEMVAAANHAARRLALDNVRFIAGDANAYDWSAFDSIYLFNPFAEALFDSSEPSEVRRERFLQTLDRVRAQLSTLPRGKQVVTYHGLGCTEVLEESFDLVHRERAHEDLLCVWRRR